MKSNNNNLEKNKRNNDINPNPRSQKTTINTLES